VIDVWSQDFETTGDFGLALAKMRVCNRLEIVDVSRCTVRIISPDLNPLVSGPEITVSLF